MFAANNIQEYLSTARHEYSDLTLSPKIYTEVNEQFLYGGEISNTDEIYQILQPKCLQNNGK